jgi:hypothetical protein
MAKIYGHRKLAFVLAGTALTIVTAAGAASADVVSALPGGNWSVSSSTTGGASAAIVAGPATPPAGTGSLALTVGSTTERALVENDLGGLALRPWTGLGASYSTYVPAGGTEFFAPSMRFAGFQITTPVATNFTTLSYEPYRNGTVTPGAWQMWTLGPTSVVWQSNATDGFCIQSAPCTLAQFLAQYPGGSWFNAQLGIGNGVAGPATGHADAVTVIDGETTFFTDFDPLAPAPPAVSPPAPPDASLAPGPVLPVTGTAKVPGLWQTGTVLLLVGGLLVMAGRRRRTASEASGTRS